MIQDEPMAVAGGDVSQTEENVLPIYGDTSSYLV